MEETESKMKEVERRKNKLRRKELAQCDFDMGMSTIKAAEEEEMAEMKDEGEEDEAREKGWD